MQLAAVLKLVPRVIRDGERVASQLAATREPARVVDVLCDKPRVRPFASPVPGVAEVIGGKLVEFKLVGFRVFVRTGDRSPTNDEIAEARRYCFDNALGSWVGCPAIGWVVLAPHEILVTAGTQVDAGTALASCRCTLDELGDVCGTREVHRTIASELPELDAESAQRVAEAMTDHVESYATIDDVTGRKNGVLVRIADFEAANERPDAQLRYGRMRVLGVPALVNVAGGH